MSQQPQLHRNIQNLIALAAAVAANHGARAAALWNQLQTDGVPEYQLQQTLAIVRQQLSAAQQAVDAQLGTAVNGGHCEAVACGQEKVQHACCSGDEDVTTPKGCCC
ncbi:MAG TPA: hypothetical protein EYH46_02535 [Sulfurivirga caldicuralii]|nr:hypothetical protein [Sulfurivirga caldicuralii]